MLNILMVVTHMIMIPHLISMMWGDVFITALASGHPEFEANINKRTTPDRLFLIENKISQKVVTMQETSGQLRKC